MSHIRLITAFLVSPLAPGAIAGVWERNLGVGVILSMFSYMFALSLGIPAYFVYRHFRWLRPSTVLAGSIFLGLISFLFDHYFFGGDLGGIGALLFAGCGGAVGLAFSLIVFTGTQPTHVVQSSN